MTDLSTTEAPLVEQTTRRSGHLEIMPMTGFSLVPTDFEQAWRISQMLANSAFVPKGFVGKPQDCLAAMAYGAEIGLSPLQALQGIAIINGKPSLYGDALIGLVRAHSTVISISETIEFTGTDKAIASCAVTRKTSDGGKEITLRSFSVDDAKRAGLWNKKGYNGADTPWITYPMRMLQMRARGFAVRDACADILKGLAMVEEQIDSPSEEVNVTPNAVAPPQTATEKLKAAVAKPVPAADEAAKAIVDDGANTATVPADAAQTLNLGAPVVTGKKPCPLCKAKPGEAHDASCPAPGDEVADAN